MNQSIIQPWDHFTLTDNIRIISGTPFLLVNQYLIMGDIHFGQQTTITGSNTISKECRDFTNLTTQALDKFRIEEIILNGDIKHYTSSISTQEYKEIQFFTKKITKEQVQITITEGNHDKLLSQILPQNPMITMQKEVRDKNILIMHGHELSDLTNVHTVILSHEHPAYNFKGYSDVSIKTPAFVKLEAKNRTTIILPAANNISAGVNFPPTTQSEFLSPFLKKYGDLRTIQMYPFSEEIGLMLLDS